MRINFILTPLLLIILFMPFCGKNNSYDFIKKQIQHKTFKGYENPDSVSVFIDASMSMQGFTGNEDYQVLMRNLLTSFSDPNKLVINLFDTSIVKVNNFKDLFLASNYRGSQANLDLMFNKVLESFEKNKNSFYVIITDFQFNNQDIYINSLVSFNKFLKNEAIIKVFVSEFDFNGMIFPQFVRDKQPYYYQGKRPIFIILFGRYPHINFMGDFIEKTFNYKNSITLSKDIPLKFDFIKKHSENKITFANKKENHFYAKEDNFRMLLNLSFPRIFNLEDYNDLNFDILAFELYQDSLIRKHPELKIDSIKQNFNDRNISLYLSSIDNIKEAKNIYKFGILPANLPEWVKNYSALPTQSQSNKTVYLYQFFEDIFRPVNEKNYLFTFYFILEKK